MDSELKILKKIWKNNETSVRLISRQIGFDNDYIRYICKFLLKKGKIKKVRGKRDWYKITPKGRKELEFGHTNRVKTFKKNKKIKNKERITYRFPPKAGRKSLKSNFQKASVENPEKKRLLNVKEKKLNIWRSIIKAVSLLKI